MGQADRSKSYTAQEKADAPRAIGRVGRRWLLACLLAVFTGCETASQDRVRQFNEDGVYLFERGEYGSARESFEVALQLQPKDAGLLYNTGQCYDRQNDAAKAEQFYQRCLQENANHAPCRHALAVLLFRSGRGNDADNMIEDWLTREPKRADAYVEDGWRLRQAGELTQAEARLQQALDLEPRNIRALTEMAILFEVLQLPERAAVLYERVLAEDPHQPAVAERLNSLRAKKVGKPLPD
jgi:Tfp pilus assembly protein PilF